MDRLNFTLPDFTRISWVTDRARDTWQGRMQKIGAAWQEIEWLAVKAGVRRCAVTVLSPEEIISKGLKFAGNGLNMLPVELQGLSTHTYSATSLKTTYGEPFGFRIVVGRPEDVVIFKNAWDEGDQETIGTCLGYPQCCREFFRQTWVDQSMVDTTWPMGARTAGITNGTRLAVTEGPPESNILWRWMGIRAVPHLPCRVDCEATVEFGRKLIQVGRDHGYGTEMDWLVEILSWPAEWSALHGIAEIKTPLLKVATRTDATPTKYVVQRKGTRYPEEGARGIRFPYETPKRPLLTGLGTFKKGQAIPITPVEDRVPDWYAADNGFDSKHAMDMAQKPIVNKAVELLGLDGGDILDLGCGNGVLLKKISGTASGVTVWGIDIAPERTGHAAEVLPDSCHNFSAGDMFDVDSYWPADRRYRLVLLMPGRLIEAGPQRSLQLLERLRKQCETLLIYAYGDWLTRYGGLAGLASQAGLQIGDCAPGATVCQAHL